jgi:hypothetical protein
MEKAKDNAKAGSVSFTPDEIETIRKLILDRGFEYGLLSNTGKVHALAAKLGMPPGILGEPAL